MKLFDYFKTNRELAKELEDAKHLIKHLNREVGNVHVKLEETTRELEEYKKKYEGYCTEHSRKDNCLWQACRIIEHRAVDPDRFMELVLQLENYLYGKKEAV